MALYLWGIAPAGVGLTGRGMEHPPPLSLACHCDTVLTSGNTPATRPLRGLLPPPPGGRAVSGDSPDTVSGGRNGVSVRVFTLAAERLSPPWHCIYGESPRGGRG